MKHFFLLALLVLSCMNAHAFDGYAEVDGINYHIFTKGGIAEVASKNTGYAGDIVIPSTIEYEGVTCTVTGIRSAAFSSSRNLESIVIPNTVTEIKSMAFSSCKRLKRANIPSSVTKLEMYAFSGCDSLETLTADDLGAWCWMQIGQDANPLVYAKHFIVGGEELVDLVMPDTLTKVNARAFHGYARLKSVTFGPSVKTVGDYAFFDCKGLESVTLSKSVEELGKLAFYNCDSLIHLDLSSGLKYIGMGCFQQCDGLTEVALPDSVYETDDLCFKECSNLKIVRIGSGLKYIGSNSFENCSEITDVYCWAVTPPDIRGSYISLTLPFYGCYPEYAKLHVPEESISAYQKSDIWKGFGSIVALTSDDTGISEVEAADEPVEVGRFGLDGKRLSAPSPGINIIRMSDGSTRRIMVR